MKKFFAVVLITLLSIAGVAGTTGFASSDGFTVTAPVTFTTDGPKKLTTDAGKPFMHTFYQGSDQDGAYFVQVSTYDFKLVPEDLQRALAGYAGALNGELFNVQNLTVSGQPAIQATVISPAITFRYLITYKGNKLFQFSYSGNGNPNGFFKSITIK